MFPNYSPAIDEGLPNGFASLRGGTKVKWIVVHVAAGYWDGTIAWFNDRRAQANSHYLVGLDGRVCQFVDEDYAAWHAYPANEESIGIEHVDDLKNGSPGWMSAAEFEASAKLTAYLLKKYGLTTADIKRHNEVGNTSHNCPGPHFPMDRYKSRVAEIMRGGASPTRPPNPSTGESMQKTPKELSEEAIEFGLKLLGTPYGTGWREGTWPDLSPLYARITRHDAPSWYRQREIICSALINVLRFEVAELPAIGRKQGDDWPGGTAAIGRHLAFAEGSKPYPPVENTPRGWLVFSPYLGPALAMQGHVGVALGNGKVLEARVPTLSNNRTENDGCVALKRGGAKPYTRIIPPSLWLSK